MPESVSALNTMLPPAPPPLLKPGPVMPLAEIFPSSCSVFWTVKLMTPPPLPPRPFAPTPPMPPRVVGCVCEPKTVPPKALVAPLPPLPPLPPPPPVEFALVPEPTEAEDSPSTVIPPFDWITALAAVTL
ncbi:MAG TPA: hypothetical protein VH597_05200 [Verrucomicrobiae bacterium]|nr:hypothetical protein [Verrucomicrobiae bacterium]